MQIDVTQTHVSKELKHNSPLMACHFSPDGRFVFFSAQDFRIWRWEWATDSKVELSGHESWVRGLALSPDGVTLLSGGYDGKIIWWSAAESQPTVLRSVQAHEGWIRALSISPDGKLVASVGNDLLVKLWDTATGSAVASLSGHESHIYNVAFHPQGAGLVTGDLKANFIHWETASGKPLRKFKLAALHKYDEVFRADIGGPEGMHFSLDGKLLACSGITNVTNAFAGVGNPAVVVWDWESASEKLVHLSKAGVKGVAWGVALHPQQIIIAGTGGPDGGRLLFWKMDQKDEFHEFKLPNTARDLALHPDGLHLATAHFDGSLRISKMAAKA